MDYKEEYQKALERAKKGLPIDEVFPELKESEDERIRKELVEYFSRTGCNFIRGIPIERIMAYLEKQKEQKPLCVSFACDWLKTNISSYVNCEYNEFHHCVEYDGSVDTERLIKDFELAMQKEPKDVSASTMAPGCWQGEEKPAEWSEEEKKHLYNAIEAVKYVYDISEGTSGFKCVEFLKSLRPQPHWKPSEEQIDALEWMLTTVSMKDGGRGFVLKNLINDLKKQM